MDRTEDVTYEAVVDTCEAKAEAKTEEAFEADSNESTLVKKAKELKKAISMCRIGNDKYKISLLMDTLRNCDAIIDFGKRLGLADPFMKPVNGCLR